MAEKQGEKGKIGRRGGAIARGELDKIIKLQLNSQFFIET